MRHKKNKKNQQQKNKYYPDVIAYYAHQKNQQYYNSLNSFVTAESIHEIAIQVFGASQYISYDDMI